MAGHAGRRTAATSTATPFLVSFNLEHTHTHTAIAPNLKLNHIRLPTLHVRPRCFVLFTQHMYNPQCSDSLSTRCCPCLFPVGPTTDEMASRPVPFSGEEKAPDDATPTTASVDTTCTRKPARSSKRAKALSFCSLASSDPSLAQRSPCELPAPPPPLAAAAAA